MDALVRQIEATADLQSAGAALGAVEAAFPVLGDDDTPDAIAEALLKLLERSDPMAASPAAEGLIDKALGRDDLVWASLRRVPTRTAIDMAGYDHVDLDALHDAVERCPEVLEAMLQAKIADVEDMDDLEED